MEDNIVVRELTARERDRLAAAKTGDRLADGSVLLRQRDMNLMGLERLRHWIASEVLSKGSMLALFDETHDSSAH
jgi:hypothetical protein